MLQPCYTSFFQTFIKNGCLILMKAFAVQLHTEHVIFMFLMLFIWYTVFIGLHMLNCPCLSGMNRFDHGVWYSLSVVEFGLQICWKIFHLCSSKISICSFVLCLYSILGSGRCCLYRITSEEFLVFLFCGIMLRGQWC